MASTPEVFDIINGNGIDYMHCVLLGVVKTLLKLWFSSSHSKEPYNVSSMLSEIDEGIKKIHLPDRVARAPRSISDYLKFFKASELRSFLFF